MKKILLITFLMLIAPIMVMAQRAHFVNWEMVFENVTCTTSNTSSAFTISGLKGAETFWISISDTTGVPGDVTVKLQMYNQEAGAWGDYYGGNSLITIGSAKIVPGAELYIPLAEFDKWAWADKCRLIIEISAGGMTFNGYIGGQ